jgi:hypothetical protein
MDGDHMLQSHIDIWFQKLPRRYDNRSEVNHSSGRSSILASRTRPASEGTIVVTLCFDTDGKYEKHARPLNR